MKRSGLLHPALIQAIAAAGHGDVIVIGDSGLRVPPNCRRIDLGVTCGVPGVVDVLRAVVGELSIESAVIASEFRDWNPDIHEQVLDELPVVPSETPHLDLIVDLAEREAVYVMTGECSAYTNVALICGVSFSEAAQARYEVFDRQRSWSTKSSDSFII
jgi:D-ribose pyranase